MTITKLTQAIRLSGALTGLQARIAAQLLMDKLRAAAVTAALVPAVRLRRLPKSSAK